MLLFVALVLGAAFDVRYINLASRTDRLAQIQSEFARQGGVQAERIAGREAERRTAAAGALACTQSHVDAVRSITADVGLIAEDDCKFVRALPAGELRQPSFRWDALMLAYNGPFNHTDCVGRTGARWCRVISMQTCSLYAVRRAYVPHLLRVWNTSVSGLARGGPPSRFAGDQTWKELQRTPGHNWFAAVPRVAVQRPGFSNIEGSWKNYGVR